MADWPALDELKQALDIASSDWDTTLERVRQSAISKVKADVGSWDDGTDEPNENQSQAALRMAELISLRPEVAAGVVSDPTYNRLLSGQRRRFGIG